MYRSIAFILLGHSALLVAGLLISNPAWALDSSCQALFEAMTKMVTTPTHVYTTETAAFRSDGRPTTNETIYAGGAIYAKVNGKWIRSTITPHDMVRQEQDNRKNAKDTCRYLHDESVSGEPAAVYSTHSESQDVKSDAQLWISKSKGLPLREELDMDVGGKLGKSHRSMRFEYGNVQPPQM